MYCKHGNLQPVGVATSTGKRTVDQDEELYVWWVFIGEGDMINKEKKVGWDINMVGGCTYDRK